MWQGVFSDNQILGAGACGGLNTTEEGGGPEESGVTGSDRNQKCFKLGKKLVRLASRKIQGELSR